MQCIPKSVVPQEYVVPQRKCVVWQPTALAALALGGRVTGVQAGGGWLVIDCSRHFSIKSRILKNQKVRVETEELVQQLEDECIWSPGLSQIQSPHTTLIQDKIL